MEAFSSFSYAKSSILTTATARVWVDIVVVMVVVVAVAVEVDEVVEGTEAAEPLDYAAEVPPKTASNAFNSNTNNEQLSIVHLLEDDDALRSDKAAFWCSRR